jgi:tRNA(Leu) C34 or U34 (ribose-2'-O)-methylase TrmL
MTTTTNTAVTPIKKGDNITIIGRKWFDRINGNTYHSVTVLVNNTEVLYSPFSYGYDDQYIQTAAKELHQFGYLPEWPDNKVFWRYCDESGINLYCTATNVTRKRDL